MLPVARNDQQLPALLEILARLEMKRDGDIKDRLRHRLALAWGISCVYFSQDDESIHSAQQFLSVHRIPAVFCVSRLRPTLAPAPELAGPILMNGSPGKVYCLDDLCARQGDKARASA